MTCSHLSVRVYGLGIYQETLLVSDEVYQGDFFTKFPGGGLEIGESPIDTLKREFYEEFGLLIDVCGHFYTTDVFQVSKFLPNTQVLAIYYFIDFSEIGDVPESEQPHCITEKRPQQLRRIPFTSLSGESLTFPLDRKVLALLKQRYA